MTTNLILYAIFGGFIFIIWSVIKRKRKTHWRLLDALLVILLACLSPHAIVVAWISAGSAFGHLDEWRYSPSNQFETSKWKSNNKYRYSVLKYVISNIAKKGKSETDILAVLGQPNGKDGDGIWHYNCERPGWRFIDFSGGGLSLKFEGNILIKSTDTTWID